MPFQSFYDLTDWQNLPSQKTALNRKNLLHAEMGIKEADNRIVQLDAKKAEQAVANLLVKSVTVDTKSGVITVTLLNGTVTTYDLDIERVVINFDITDDNKLVLTLADGTTKEVDLTKFVNLFKSTSTIALNVTDRVVTANIVDGSVTMDKLDSAIQLEFRQYMLNAKQYMESSLQYMKFSKRYAVSDPEFEGSDTDCSKYYYEQSKTNAGTSGANAKAAAASAETALDQAGIATQKAINAAASATNATAGAQTSSEKATIAINMAATATEKAQEAADSELAAKEKATQAESSAKLAKRYAVGGEVQGDAEDNSQWYCEQAENFARLAQEVTDIVYPDVHVDIGNGHLMVIGGNKFTLFLDGSGHLISSVGSEGVA